MITLFDAARDLQAVFDARAWRFCFIGGLAVLRWGEPRFTGDVDVSLLCPFGSEDEFTEPLLQAGYAGRIRGCDGRTPGRPALEPLRVRRRLLAFRPRDILDVETVALRRGPELDWDYIEANLAPLAGIKAQPEIMATLRKLRKQP